MAIDMSVRKDAVERNDMFRNRVSSRMIDLAMAAYTTAPVTGASVTTPPTLKQTKRIDLAAKIVKDAMAYVEPFAWWLVSISSYTTIDDITDQQIINQLQVTGAFDQIADQILLY